MRRRQFSAFILNQMLGIKNGKTRHEMEWNGNKCREVLPQFEPFRMGPDSFQWIRPVLVRSKTFSNRHNANRLHIQLDCTPPKWLMIEMSDSSVRHSNDIQCRKSFAKMASCWRMVMLSHRSVCVMAWIALLSHRSAIQNRFDFLWLHV